MKYCFKSVITNMASVRKLEIYTQKINLDSICI